MHWTLHFIAPEEALRNPIHPNLKQKLTEDGSINKPGGAKTPAEMARKWAAGVMVAISSGTFGALQYAVVQIGKGHEQDQHGCRHNTSSCPAGTLQFVFDCFAIASIRTT